MVGPNYIGAIALFDLLSNEEKKLYTVDKALKKATNSYFII